MSENLRKLINQLERENMQLSMMEEDAQNAALKYKTKWLTALEQIEDLNEQLSKK